jgi:pimeloyl-ACP methyl ester carboxylesterase
MKLFVRELGSGPPLIILHGLFGMSDNWMTLAKRFSENGFHVFVPDLRNHGQSPHNDEWNFEIMAEDVFELMLDKKINRAVVTGHSLGGKVAMQMAAMRADRLPALIVSDIAPRKYPVIHSNIIAALNEVKIENLSSRKEAEEILSKKIKDVATLQFLLKNIYWRETVSEKKLAWRFNLDVISKKIENGSEEIRFPGSINIPALLMRGERSDYVTGKDIEDFKSVFPQAQAVTIKNSGHWIHADRPEEFFNVVNTFLKSIL